jgi:peptidoglycan/xylan/chitin deacetylase (PgdA/CDA1 family)
VNLKVLPWAGFTAAVTYTFDDSSPSQVDHYRDIAAAGVPVTFYITKGNSYYAGYEATWKAALAAGHELGNHSVHHCNFDQACGGAAAGSSASEVDDATSYIKSTLGAPSVWTMAYPFGDTGYEPLAQTRFFVARGVDIGTVKPGSPTDPWNLPIFGARGGETASALDDRIDAAHAEGSWLIFLFHSLAPNSEAWYAPVDVANVTASIAHAKSAGDIWIDTLATIGAYWIGEGIIEKATSRSTASGRRLTWSVPTNFPPGRYVRVTVDGGELSQKGVPLSWNAHGFYEVALDAGELTLK